MTSHRDLVPLQSGLDAVVRSLKGTDALTVRTVFSGWDDVVGPVVAAHSRPLKLDGKVLIVEVDEPGWATQLRYLERELLDHLQCSGSGPIERVEITVAGSRGRSRRPVRNRRSTPHIPAD